MPILLFGVYGRIRTRDDRGLESLALTTELRRQYILTISNYLAIANYFINLGLA